MSDEGHIISYELSTLKDGRWEIHATFPEDKKNEALAEAKSFEGLFHVQAVRLVMDTYNHQDGESNEFVVYQTPKDKIKQLNKPSPRAPQPATKAKGKEPARKPAPAPERSSSKKVRYVTQQGSTPTFFGFVKIVIVMLASIAAALVFTWLTWMVLSTLENMGISMQGINQDIVLFCMFVFGFFITAIPLAKSVVSQEDISTTVSRVVIEPETPPAPSDNDAVEVDVEPDPPVEEEEEEPQAPELEEEEELAELDDTGEAQKIFMMKFLGEELQEVQGSGSNLDGYNRFGVNLFLAGAVESLAQSQGLNKEAVSRILYECVFILGFKEDIAKSFANRYDQYLLEGVHYVHIFQSGRTSMAGYLEDPVTAPKHLAAALKEWNKPRKEEEEKKGPITVLFTDLVGSTSLTQTRGDHAAQEIVRVHNRIVRSALLNFRGKEVKHTGDGIMASFTATSDAVESSITIQNSVKEHNLTHPEDTLSVRIGINAGEPIAEDDDLFGTTVQLAARLCDKAEPDQILVSDIVHGICAGRNFHFINRGRAELKGFKGTVQMHETLWDPARIMEFTAQNLEAEASEKALAEAEASQPGEETAQISEQASPEGEPQDTAATPVPPPGTEAGAAAEPGESGTASENPTPAAPDSSSQPSLGEISSPAFVSTPRE
ncbi:MAG: hypothetical protein OEY85_02060 [Rhodospirillales bacterium]|nr:hypothetical protein [Rhodospirillales bacterium]